MLNISHHITGYHGVRELTRQELPDYNEEPAWMVSWGDTNIKVYGYGLCEGDVEDAAREFMDRKGCADLGVPRIVKVK